VSILLLVLCFGLLRRELLERERAQGALAKSEKWFSTTLASIGDAVIATDMDGAVTFMNSVAQSLTGWTQAEATGNSMDLVFDIVNKETRRPVENPVKKVFREGKVVGLADHTLLLSKDGKEFEIEDSAAPIVTDTGEGFGVVLVFRNITDKKRIEEQIKRQKELLHLILESIAEGVVVADSNGKFLLFNAAAEQVVGIGATDTTPDQWSDRYGSYLPDTVTLYPPNELPLARAMRGESIDAVELFIRNARVPDGRLLSITGRPLRGEDGALQGGVVVLHDITERKRAEEELRRSEERFRLILESVVDYAILMLDPEGHVVSWNDGAERIKGYRAEEILGKHFSVFYSPEDIERGKPQHELEVATAKGRFEDEGYRVRKDGSTFWANVVITPLHKDSGALRGFAKVTRDITERKLKDEALVRAKEVAELASKFKDQFLSTMSHELRTPLNAILGFSDLLRDPRYGPLNDRQSRFTDHIHTGGEHLLSLINDILDLSKIEAGRLELAIESLPVEQAFGDVLNTVLPLAEKKRLGLSQRCEPGLNVLADATRFKQVLMNLVGNALKFTPEGGSVELVAFSTEGQVRVEVRDTGPGIPEEEQKRVFEAFYRLRQSGQSPEGTGLGLAITQRLLELQGGKLELTSQPGQGSCFYFSLPAARRIAPPAPTNTKETVRRTGDAARILVVEDDALTVQLIKSQLTSAGYEVMVCSEPQRALAIAAALQPDAITLDLLMKPMSGWEILLQLKNQSSTANIPIIVISIVDQRAGGTLLGADEFLIKPVNKSVLLATVERCLAAHGGRAPSRPILVVEDDAAAREVIVEMLTNEGYAVITAADGAQARVLVAASLPELVILDLMLPKVSGFELIADWRSNPRTADLPVFVLSSKDLTPEEERYIRQQSEYLFRKQDSWQESLARQLRRVVTHGQVESV
jgi:PAS domain S-box-containing protein